MTHKYPYFFTLDKGRVLQYKRNKQISRLHSFSYNKLQNSTKLPITNYNNQVACADYDGTIVVINIFTRRKKVIHSKSLKIQSIFFLNENWLITTDSNGHVQIHNLTTLRSRDIRSESIIIFLRNTNTPSLEFLSTTLLEPLLSNKSFERLFDLISDNPFLKETIAYAKLDKIYHTAFHKAIDALQNKKTEEASLLLEKFKSIKSKKIQINALFQDFRHFERFTFHITDKKYAIAYAISSKHSSLIHTQEYEKMEAVFQKSFNLARSQMQLGQKTLAKETLSNYITILSKRDEIKNLLENVDQKDTITIDKEKLLRLYKKNSFKECYELLDESNIKDLQLVELLEKHWVKLMIKCEDYALDGNIKEIKISLGELISTQTRADKIGDLLRLAFYSKITILIQDKNFNSAQNIIYSYIDIFGEDVEIKDIMKEFEKSSSNKLAITQKQLSRESRYGWQHSSLIMEY